MRTSYAFAAVGLAVLGLAGCELVLGIDDREVYKAPAVDAGPDVSADGPSDATEEPDGPSLPPGCTLPTRAGSDPNLRIGNLIASKTLTHVDFCLKPSGTSSWAGITPLLRTSGTDCPKGLAFRDITAQFFVEPGVYEVKVIDSADTCESEGVASMGQAQIEAKKANDLFVYGDGANNTIARFQESRTAVSSAFKMRLIHAGSGLGAVDLGLPDNAKLPAQLNPALLFTNVPFGATAAKGSASSAGAVDQNGYIDVQVPSSSLIVGVAPTGETAAIMLRNVKMSVGQAYTLFIAGLKDNPAFPLQLWTCSEMENDSTKVFASCGDALPLDVSFDVFNTQLNGSFSAYEEERRQPIIDALAQLESDVVCVTEVWSQADKKAIADAAAASNFKYSFYTNHDWDTTVDDPTDQNGQVPPTYENAACTNSIDKMNAALDCLKTNCMGGNEDGKPDASFKTCIMSCATSGLIPLITGTPDDRSCWSCIFTQMASYETVAWTRDKCANDPKARFVFRGADGAMVLSKRPISNPSAWVLPATEWRVSVLRAPITMDNGANIDTYCTVLTTPTTSCLTRPYTGQYGGTAGAPTDCNPQWTAELVLQSKKLVDHVKKSSIDVGSTAVILGDFYSGTGYSSGGNEVLTAQYADAYQNLTGAFVPAVPLDYAPVCTYCANENPIITPPGTPTTADNTWTSNVFLGHYPVSLVRSAGVLLNEPVIELPQPDAGTLTIPLSQYYLFRSTVRIYP